ncbi:carboxymuconolactone decarboxylase family protein [Shewanella gelidii]|uniref:Alkyl hydroperoxide reductase AhpD n=1 Tax=Shewanella gelidii TaxID=1642821 RepID=A0A917JNJ9_9GAMM|nr:hypothetical protein [Shewanella gelidii]MCL1097775.1 hypothetical protein [Shewanella gelidii]GGI78844.1 alkyl hydroperoxide reductase AhpD [Shewanella gelidii]
MSLFAIMPPVEFEQQYPQLHTEVCEKLGLGFVPNIFRCMALVNEPLALSSWQMVKQNLCAGNLPRMVKELLFSFVAYKRRCQYCYIAHHALAIHHGFSEGHVKALFDDIESAEPPILGAVLKFADLATEPHFVDPDSAYKDMQALGLSQSETVEVLGMVSCALYMVNIADGLGLPVDERFITVINQE